MSRVGEVATSPEEFSILRENMAKSLVGKNNPMYGRNHSDESKNKISRSISGINHWNYGNTGSKCVWYGKHHSDETKYKMSRSSLGRKKSEESKKHMREI